MENDQTSVETVTFADGSTQEVNVGVDNVVSPSVPAQKTVLPEADTSESADNIAPEPTPGNPQ